MLPGSDCEYGNDYSGQKKDTLHFFLLQFLIGAEPENSNPRQPMSGGGVSIQPGGRMSVNKLKAYTTFSRGKIESSIEIKAEPLDDAVQKA